MITLTRDYMDTPKARAVPGARWDPAARAWVLDAPTPRGALVALRLFPGLARSAPELVAMRDALGQDVRPADYASEWWTGLCSHDQTAQLTRWHRVYTAMLEQGTPPARFQRQDISYLAALLRARAGTADAGAYLGWERGLGKTTATLAIAEATGAQRILIVTPNTSKYTVWLPHLEKFGLTGQVLPNAKVKREQAITHLAMNPTEPHVLIVHYEQLAIIRKQLGHWKRLGEWDLVVADEAHHFANPKTQMARALKTIPSRMRLALSGSIIQNRADELFSPLQWLFPQRYSSLWRDWNDRFLDFVDIGHREYIGVKIEMLDALRDELGRFMTYRRGEDELDLPPVTTEELPVQLSAAQQRVYTDLRDHSIAEIDTATTLSAPNAIALLTRLRQVATGLSLVSDHVEDSAKLDVAQAIIEDNPDEAFVVFSYFVGAAEALAERLGDQAFLVTSNTKHADRADYVRSFQAGERRVFVGTLGTLGESHTLDRAAQVLFLDRAWNPSLNAQAVDRVAGGFRRKRHIHVTNLVAIGTVDETNVSGVLADKAALRAMILGAT